MHPTAAFLAVVRGWWRRLLGVAPDDLEHLGVDRPWMISWGSVPKRSVGPGFTAADYDAARRRAVEVARATLGENIWLEFVGRGYTDLPSRIFPGLTYRLRVGRRIEFAWADEEAEGRSPWPWRYLCINPVYPLPAAEFAAQLYLYMRDREESVVRLVAPQPDDQVLGRTY